MNAKQKEDLLKAAELIARKRKDVICIALNSIGSDLDIHEDSICNMFNPFCPVWWGRMTMDVRHNGPEARNARLLGIAFMLTMPEDMIE